MFTQITSIPNLSQILGLEVTFQTPKLLLQAAVSSAQSFKTKAEYRQLAAVSCLILLEVMNQQLDCPAHR